jgi:flagellar protein FliS
MIPTARNPYLESTVQTASPARLLVMLCERLVLDCQRGTDALESGDHSVAHLQLLHAQDIVAELHSTLRTDAWDGAEDLGRLYGHLQVSLVQANVRHDAELARHCLEIATQLADTWREAALQSAAATA